MIWYLLFIPMLLIVLSSIGFGSVLCAEFEIKGRLITAYTTFVLILVVVMAVVVSGSMVMASMTSPVLRDSVYDKIAIEMFYKS